MPRFESIKRTKLTKLIHKQYFEDYEDEVDPVDFDAYIVRPRLDAKARKQSMWMAEQVALADSVCHLVLLRNELVLTLGPGQGWSIVEHER